MGVEIPVYDYNGLRLASQAQAKNDQPIALARAHLGSRLHLSRGQSSVLENWRSLGSPQMPGPSFPTYESPPTANRQVHWWGFTSLQDGSRLILPPSGWGKMYIGIEKFWTKLALCNIIFWKLVYKTKVLKLNLQYQNQTTQAKSLYKCRAVLILCKLSSVSVRYVSRDIIHVFKST